MLLDRLARWVPTDGVPTLALPRRVAVVGRTSAGKTSLINRLTGGARRTGLGGVTRGPEEIPDGDHTWIDTPGIDSRERALEQLGPVLDAAHAVIWVVDGLQPVTRTERDVLELLVLPGQPVDVVVSRADLLDPDELTSVLARTRAHTALVGPSTVTSADLRSQATSLDVLRHTRLTGPERDARRVALLGLRPALVAARPLDPPSLAALVTLRPAVKAWLARLDASEAGVSDLLKAFQPELQAIADDAVVRWAADPRIHARMTDLPHLPRVPDPSWSTIDSLRLGAAGVAATRRELRGLAASWVAEAELRLADWREGQTFDPDALAAHTADLDALSAELRELGHEDHEG
ncbi:MAG: 50S ribosome-binding GTPase [Alphaproteobacteria bacterium]|nr:50S ribosome-binding GTPase [Alphaproteobacteria bacterium]